MLRIWRLGLIFFLSAILYCKNHKGMDRYDNKKLGVLQKMWLPSFI